MNVSKPGGTLQDAIKNTDLAVYASILATHQINNENIEEISDSCLISIGILASHIHRLRQICKSNGSNDSNGNSASSCTGANIGLGQSRPTSRVDLAQQASTSFGGSAPFHGPTTSIGRSLPYDIHVGRFAVGGSNDQSALGGAYGLSGFSAGGVNAHSHSSNRVGPYSYIPRNSNSYGASSVFVQNKRKNTNATKKLVVTFCALADPDQSRRPTHLEKLVLNKNGLGEAQIVFEGKEDSRETYEIIYNKYPLLKDDGGGFCYLYQPHGKRKLERVECGPILALKEKVKNGIIYLRPVQREIDLEEAKPDPDSLPHEICFECGKDFRVDLLEEHRTTCPRPKTNSSNRGNASNVRHGHNNLDDRNESESSDKENDALYEPPQTRSKRARACTYNNSTSSVINNNNNNSTTRFINNNNSTSTTSFINNNNTSSSLNFENTIIIDGTNHDRIDDYDQFIYMREAIKPDELINDEVVVTPEEVPIVDEIPTPDMNYIDTFKLLFSRSGDWKISIRRKAILWDTIKEINFSKDAYVTLKSPFVKFLLEEAIDCGGVTRAFHSELLRSLRVDNSLLVGQKSRQLVFDPDCLQKKAYGALAKLLVHLLMYSGTTIGIFSGKYVELIITGNGDFDITDVVDSQTQYIVEKVLKSDDWFDDKFTVDLLTEMKIDNPLGINRNTLAKMIVNYKIKEQPAPAIDQFREALEQLNVLNEMKANILKFKSMLSFKQVNLVPGDIFNLFHFTIPDDPALKDKEEDVAFYLQQYTHCVAEGLCFYEVNGTPLQVKLENVLEFLTGADYLPYNGSEQICVKFYDAEIGLQCSPLPTASTCSLEFNCPRNFKDYDSVERVLNMVIMESKCYFGQK